jgi:hypothetical protein
MPLAKPRRQPARRRRHVKILMHLAPDQALLDAAELARYVSNPYHRPPGSPMGQPIKRPYPHASKCPPTWELGAATRALKEAIRAGWVSPDWRGGFPQAVWYKDVEIVYQAVLSNRTSGEYHAYPLESRDQWPKGL